MMALSWNWLIAGLLAQARSAPEAPPAPSAPSGASGILAGMDAAERLASMKRAAASYLIHPADDRGATYRLNPEPILRFSNPLGPGVRDGAIFFWYDAQERPVATLQIFLDAKDHWMHELTSLSTGRLVAEPRTGVPWTPSRPGIEFRPLPGAPKPASTAVQRLRQMHALAEGFAIDDYWKDKDWHKLRLMPRPLTRYGKPGTGLLDGALFCFSLTTDPEVFLFLEAVEDRDGSDGGTPSRR